MKSETIIDEYKTNIIKGPFVSEGYVGPSAAKQKQLVKIFFF